MGRREEDRREEEGSGGKRKASQATCGQVEAAREAEEKERDRTKAKLQEVEDGLRALLAKGSRPSR